MKNLIFKLFFIAFIFILTSCQDTELQSVEEEELDQDMITALELANEFFGSARVGSDKDVTVIKFKDNLVFKTNTIAGSYQPIDEETVTAESERGGYIFWHAGGGVSELVQIELDDASQAALGNYEPFEVVPGRMWALWIPEEMDLDLEHLKYDIVYITNNGDYIRLDPKIRINQ